jgi:hypothetical protein
MRTRLFGRVLISLFDCKYFLYWQSLVLMVSTLCVLSQSRRLSNDEAPDSLSVPRELIVNVVANIIRFLFLYYTRKMCLPAILFEKNLKKSVFSLK